MGNIQGLISRLKNEVGYIEKASNSNLDSKTGNKGLNNYTKYARDINNLGLMGCQAHPWCATFQFWVEVQEFGLDTALTHFNMSKSTYVGYNVFSTKSKFPANKRSKTPKLGCLVVFTHSHIGRVIAISGNTITTIEGNTSAQSYDRNGGMVAQKTYNINDNKIDCFLTIDYDSDENETTISGDLHTVKKGDTLSKIAKQWNVSVSEIASFNSISNPNVINIGQVIKKPSKQPETAPQPSGWNAINTATCTGNSVNVRSSPDMGNNILRRLDKGNRFEIDGQKQNGFHHIKVEGAVAWISSQYVRED